MLIQSRSKPLKPIHVAMSLMLMLLITPLTACVSNETTDTATAAPMNSQSSSSAAAADVCESSPLTILFDDDGCQKERRKEGLRLFDHETFGGNGRTCVSCHTVASGTINPEQLQAKFLNNPNDPLFQHDGLDASGGVDRLLQHATFLVELPLPPWITLVDDPAARSVVLPRGVPTTINSPAFDDFFQWDMRINGLQDQAASAIDGHAQATQPPTSQQLELLEEIQMTDRRFFSSDELYEYANGIGLEPGLPEGNSESEIRGRRFFEDNPYNPPSLDGLCALCHSGTLLNKPNAFMPTVLQGVPPTADVHSAGVSERNLLNLPEHTYAVTDACGNVKEVTTADPGILLSDPWTLTHLAIPPKETCQIHPANFTNLFKTSSLRGIASTAPYFHDNSAKTLEDAVRQYNFMLETQPYFYGEGNQLSEQDIADIVAFMKLL